MWDEETVIHRSGVFFLLEVLFPHELTRACAVEHESEIAGSYPSRGTER